MKYNRHSLRLKDYDYTLPGPYFVTTIIYGRETQLGNVLDGEMQLNESGQIVTDAWQWLGRQFPYLELGAAVVMPNHFHGIILIGDDSRRGGSRPPYGNVIENQTIGSIGRRVQNCFRQTHQPVPWHVRPTGMAAGLLRTCDPG